MTNSPLQILDILGCGLLAMSGSCRARVYGFTHTGAVVLACFSALSSPTARDLLLNKSYIASLNNSAYLGISILGCLIGFICARWHVAQTFRLIETFSLAILSVTGAVYALTALIPTVGVILIGITTGCIGGLLRDLCLGDTPQAMEREFYVMASALGSMLVIVLWTKGFSWEWYMGLGVLLISILRLFGFWREQS